MIRVVTYNVSGGLDTAAVASVLRRLRPGIVCLLEAPGPKRLRSLARAADLEVAGRSGRRGIGTAVLIGEQVRMLSTAAVPLSVPRGIPAREATHTILSVGGRRLSVTAVQLGLRPEVRASNYDELVDYLGSIDLPKVIGADLNESVRSPVAAAMAVRFKDAYGGLHATGGATYPTNDPSSRQDFVFVDQHLEVVGCRVPTEPPVEVASHHRPVVADLDLANVVLQPDPKRPSDHRSSQPSAIGSTDEEGSV